MGENVTKRVPLDLGAIDQVSYAVRNLSEALPRYEQLFGTFTTMTTTLTDIIFRGQKSEAVLNLAFGKSGSIEVELVEPVSGNFPQVEFLAQHGEGLHHVRYAISDLEEKKVLLEEQGYCEVVRGQSPGVRFAYFEAPAFMGDSMVELLQWDKN